MADKKVDAATGEVKLERGPALIDVISPMYKEALEEAAQEKEQARKVLPDSYKEMLDKAVEEKECQEHAPFIRIHCKPVYNYQSVEFDWDIRAGSSKSDMEALEHNYELMLKMLVRVSENAPQKEANKPAAPVEEPASEKQKEILRNFHIDFKPDITKKQAHALIKKSMDQEIF